MWPYLAKTFEEICCFKQRKNSAFSPIKIFLFLISLSQFSNIIVFGNHSICSWVLAKVFFVDFFQMLKQVKQMLIYSVRWQPKWRHDSQHDDSQHNDTQHKDTQYNNTQTKEIQHNNTKMRHPA